MVLPAPIQSLLLCQTPSAWLEEASRRIPILLIDQANCEKKAAATAVSLLHRSSVDERFTLDLSRIAREELKHLELVLKACKRQGVQIERLSAGRYAGALHTWMSKREPERLIDQLLVCAMIEARSCERIGALLSILEGELQALYEKLHDAEDRHFEFYVARASELDAEYAGKRLQSLRQLDAGLVMQPDQAFRFHSGLPSS
ncbi:MAG: tRNA-(ms[2]io[6]A)-hydroxylase [Gammaproteobacteria bacterium]|nr:tRNA-(ms[2]io[6]A)-hydroxylase [Gammaproteobacteria bacterium]